MNKTSGAVAVIAALVIGAALVAGSLLVRTSLDRQTAAIAGVQEALKTLNQSVQASAAARPAPPPPPAAVPTRRNVTRSP